MSLPSALHIAIDLGAGSGRVVVGGFAPEGLFFQEAHRFAHPLTRRDGHLRWDAGHVLAEITRGLRVAATIAGDVRAPLRSIGVDSWGVDYGLLDAASRLVADPISYRDERTAGQMDRVFAKVPRDEIFRRTGIQFLPLNTIYQLFAEVHAGQLPARASQLVLIADLFHVLLGGRTCCEFTNATTTQMLSAATGEWDDELLAALGLPRRLMPSVVPPGTTIGTLSAASQNDTRLGPVPIVTPATHDTASAIAGAPLDEGCAYISSGTWSLVGIEREAPLLDPEVARLNFTNEGGVGGRTLFHQNVMGMWLLERCRDEWQSDGTPLDYAELGRFASAPPSDVGIVDPDAPRFFNPSSMVTELQASLRETGQPVPPDPPSLARVILDSLALKYARVIRNAQRLSGQPIRSIRIVGGGSQNAYLNQATADASGFPVVAGPVEATAIGNLAIQAMAAGRFGTLAEARAAVRQATPAVTSVPRGTDTWKARERDDRTRAERSGAQQS